MSEKHLEAGQPLPALTDGSIRLFSMRYCPFAQRPRLVLHAKGVKYEEINCNLKRKPEFLLERHPDGKVPVLEQDGKVIIESNVINDFLDDVYPNPPLYPKDPFKKAQDKVLMETFSSKVIPSFYKAISKDDEEEFKKLNDGLTTFEAELIKRGTLYFGGEQPSMVDYNTWPFMERIIVVDKLNDIMAKLPTLDAYCHRMMAHPAVKAVLNSKQAYDTFYKSYLGGNTVYDF